MKNLTQFLFSLSLFLSFAQQADAIYDPTIGRWLSRDPIGDGNPSMRVAAEMHETKLDRISKQLLTSPLPAEILQGPNLYLYVINNPINLIDPFGTDYMVCSLFGHASGTVWDNQGNQTTFDFSPIEGWRETSGGPPFLSLPVLYYLTTSKQDQQLLDAFREQVRDQPGRYNPFTNNCWQGLGKTANPFLKQ